MGWKERKYLADNHSIMRLFWLSLAALSAASAMAAPPQPPQAESATNIVFPGRANEDDDSRRRGGPSAAAPTVDTKDVREQGREKCELEAVHISLEEVA